jgi:hypothetical protein
MTIYILKIQGTNKNADRIQIRDEDFNLIAYFRITSPESALAKCHLLDKMEVILLVAGNLTYGKIQKLEL